MESHPQKSESGLRTNAFVHYPQRKVFANNNGLHFSKRQARLGFEMMPQRKYNTARGSCKPTEWSGPQNDGKDNPTVQKMPALT
jgi:hypothetical protein